MIRWHPGKFRRAVIPQQPQFFPAANVGSPPQSPQVSSAFGCIFWRPAKFCRQNVPQQQQFFVRVTGQASPQSTNRSTIILLLLDSQRYL